RRWKRPNLFLDEGKAGRVYRKRRIPPVRAGEKGLSKNPAEHLDMEIRSAPPPFAKTAKELGTHIWMEIRSWPCTHDPQTAPGNLVYGSMQRRAYLYPSLRPAEHLPGAR